MKARIEVSTFADGKLKVVVRFVKNSNFWINEYGEEATWVPSFDELEVVGDTLQAIKEYNLLHGNK